MFLFVPLGDRSFFIRIDKDKSGKVIIPKGQAISLSSQDVSMLASKLIPPIIMNMGYTPDEMEKIKEVLNKPVINIDTIIPLVDSVRSYEETNEMDVVISGHAWRMKDKDFLSPVNFQIWVASVLHYALDISKEEWRSFVGFLVTTAKKEKEDPLGPNIIDELLKKLKMTNIYSDFCDALVETWTDGSRESMLLKDGKLYVPASVIDGICKKLELSKKKVRDVLQSVMDEQNSVVVSKRWNGRNVSKRVWVINFEKLKKLRDMDEVKIIEVNENAVSTETTI